MLQLCEMLGAEASVVFMGNTKKSVPYMMKHSHFFEELPDKYIDSAFLDRLHCYNAGWESSPVRSELFTEGFGFIVDYLAEILRHLASRPGRVYTRGELLELLRDYEALDQDEKTINVHVSHLRDKIEDDPTSPAFVLTVRGVGYAFAER